MIEGAYHYTRCGLDNVWLVNGYRIEDMGEYGQSVVVEHVENLERAIARRLTDLDRRLTGAEFRYLRTMLDLSQTAMGRVLGKDGQTIARWEGRKRKPVPQDSDAAIRQRYRESIGVPSVFSRIQDRLAELATSAANGESLPDENGTGLSFKEEEASGEWHGTEEPVLQDA